MDNSDKNRVGELYNESIKFKASTICLKTSKGNPNPLYTRLVEIITIRKLQLTFIFGNRYL